MKEQQSFYEQKLKYETDSWDLSDALSKNKNVIVIDARSNKSFDIEHIPGAINIPYRNMTAENTNDLKKNKSYVVYCNGIGCNASTKAAINMSKLGYEIKELLWGLDWWKRDGFQTEGSKASPGKEIQCDC